MGIRISPPREAHHREGSEKFTLQAIIAEEEHVFEMVDEYDNRARLDVRRQDVGDQSADQQRAITASRCHHSWRSRCRRPRVQARRTPLKR